MLDKPENGFARVSLGAFESYANYIFDTPFDWLKSCKTALQNKVPLALFIDEGAGNFCYIISFYDTTYVVIHKAEDKDAELKTINELDFMDITDMLLRDIEADLEEWVRWYAFEDTEEDFARRRVELRKLLGEVEEALQPEAKRYKKPYAG